MYEPSRSKNRRKPYRPTPPKTNLKDDLARVLREEDLARKLKFVQALTEESKTDLEHVAAALLFLLEGQRRKTSERPPRPFSPSRSREQDRNRYPASGFSDRREQRPGARSRPAPAAMTKYRIEVGRVHGVGPGQIVGAIANESDLSGADIGGIDIQTHFSTVDLPGNLTEETVRGLGQVRVAGQALRLTKWERGGDRRLQEKPQRFQKKRGGKPSWKKSRKRVSPPAPEGQTPS